MLTGKKPTYFLVAGGLLALAFGVVLARPAIAAQLHNWRLLPASERFTELYFDDHQRLPKHMQAGKTYTTTVTVHNSEGAAVTYRYALTLESADSPPHQIDEGAITLQPDEAQNIKQTFIAPMLESRTKVVFQLRYTKQTPGRAKRQTQTVHFWTQPGASQLEENHAAQ